MVVIKSTILYHNYLKCQAFLKKKIGDYTMNDTQYYLGLDLGTESVGFAATELDYSLCKKNGKALWGFTLFDESKPAMERRTFRNDRRRTHRKKQRIQLLQSLFANEIANKDNLFFLRLNESKYHPEDKQSGIIHTLFDDEDFNDIIFHEKYPTIYHLRKALVDNERITDVRLVYLAIHHIIKHRGHFLFDSVGENGSVPFGEIFNYLLAYLQENFEVTLDCTDTTAFSAIIKDRNKGKTAKEFALLELCNINKKLEKQKHSVIKSLCGMSVNLHELFNNEDLKDAKEKFEFQSDFEQTRTKLMAVLDDEQLELIDRLKAIYDWGILAGILNGNAYISYAKVGQYEQHKTDLALLKKVVKEYCPQEYNPIFNAVDKKGNYPSYVGYATYNGKKQPIDKSCKQEELCKYLKGILGKISCDDENMLYLKDIESMKAKLDDNTFLPKQVSGDNGVIPQQVHCFELTKILENASKQFAFLNEKDQDGMSVSEKISSIFTFRIPYYVGPLNRKSPKSWLVRTNEKIYPWNFEKVVDTDASAENFILNMTNKCTYLPLEDVIPKNSLLYSEFMVLNELNNLKINGQAISPTLKTEIYNDLFLKFKKVSNKKLRDYLLTNNHMQKDDTISGIDGDFKTALTSYHDFKRILDTYNSVEMVEDIIRWIVLFGDARKILKNRVQVTYRERLSENDIAYVTKLKYSGWGNFSKAFLNGEPVACVDENTGDDITSCVTHIDKNTGEACSIITMLRSTTENLMELLSGRYTFVEALEKCNCIDTKGNKIKVKERVDALYVSPSIKRPILQALSITSEIVKLQKGPPKKIFVEVAREKQKDKKRTVSRKAALLELYKNCEKEEPALCKELSKQDESTFKRDRLYLYYTQMGKCMYTGTTISLSDIYNENLYDVDHIYPQSKIKDDSLNNRVLVTRQSNAVKSNHYPIESGIRTKQHGLWATLKSKNLISESKYNRLTRSEPLSDAELGDFIARQLVQTRQSTKAVAQILKDLYPNTEIVYVKANTVSEFRQQNKFVKSRDVNDLHHAKDAYLNIVVGNVYNTKYTHSKSIFIKGLQSGNVSLNKMFERDVAGAWVGGENGTFATVKKTIAKNNVLFTRYALEQHGGFYDQTLMKKGLGQAPIKASDQRLSDISKYGGFNKVSGCYFILVEHTVKGKRERTFEPVFIYLRKVYEENNDGGLQYCTDVLKLTDPIVLIKKIKMKTLFCLDGFRMHLRGRSGDKLLFQCAIQLCVGEEMEAYIKKISKYMDKCKTLKEQVALNVLDGISQETNLKLYDVFINKLENTIYHIKFSHIADYCVQSKEIFMNLTAEKQSSVLFELIKIMHCNASLGDLKLINYGSTSGNISTSKNMKNIVKNAKEFKIIYQSPTGVFEQEIDLLGDDFTPKPRKGR